MRETTLCYIEKNDKYLILHRTKKKLDGSYEKWIGVGGKFEEGEDAYRCVSREVKEETGFDIKSPDYRGKVYFHSDTWEDEIMHLFTVKSFSGTMIECNEGELVWVDKDKVLDLPTWEGDRLFLTRLLSDEKYFELELFYEGENLVKHKFL